MILLRALPILWAITIHEFAHGWMAHKCGDDTALHQGRLTLNPLAHLDPFGTLAFLIAGFGWARPVPVNRYNFRRPSRDDILVSLAGVGANLLSAIAFALIFRLLYYAPGIDLAGTFRALLYLGVRINLILLFFNLIPVPPLDGSHVLAELLPWDLRQRYQEIVVPYGPFILLGLIFVLPMMHIPLLGYIIGKPVSLLTQLLTGISF